MKKTKSSLTIADAIDNRKPLTKEYVNPSEVVDRILNVRLPYVKGCTAIHKLVFTSKDKLTTKYRVNWFHPDGFIARSGYFELTQSPDGYNLAEKK
jgi:hypothetical protein